MQCHVGRVVYACNESGVCKDKPEAGNGHGIGASTSAYGKGLVGAFAGGPGVTSFALDSLQHVVAGVDLVGVVERVGGLLSVGW